ncbi:tRNA pseudouridine32 synthase / 23S rRNA pseudouridine746 synthase [Desulfacinum hydrothermale DSM 13146]|uniref:tRNA pseudouridine32 synthase / 23S rRNA pseudouridine746 synthase n=1 Tax=Desulfacinum hydrothermale DSM 13146 TaxID=1121390 RepID=A0A1W1XVM3_9BACT|nr:TIGR01621 family pseudouridine synthase [Desulfacinum hydrothermale]SMC27927.1 tRNA pseudouridine32 synthase / 23S rRNA pseudouridine746 synthase [Desulfacinum hydrothermale DSM 13146]
MGPIPVLHEDDHLLVVHKPAGISFHGTSGGQGLPGLLRRQTGLEPLIAVHRLDRITSGVLVLARSQEAARELGRIFREREIAKYYLAISDRKPKKKQGTVAGDMARSRRGTWKLLRTRVHPAVTHFTSLSMAPGLRLFLLKPETGRTHQVRVALKALGSPVLGDPLYWSPGPAIPEPDRAYLHAYRIRFRLFGTPYDILAPPVQGRLFAADAFRKALSRIRAP